MKTILLIIFILWELPQNISGLILYLLTKNRIAKKEIIKNRLFLKVTGFAISLGSFIFWTGNDNPIIKIKQSNKAHEYGHAIQSMIFGPVYLIMIGIPSVGRNVYGFFYNRIKKKRWEHYYHGYPEDWADRLGSRFFQETPGNYLTNFRE